MDCDDLKEVFWFNKPAMWVTKKWQGFVEFCRPALDFHDKWCVHIWWIVLLVGMAAVTSYPYLCR